MALFGQTGTLDGTDALGLLPWTAARRPTATPPFLDTADANAVTQQQDQTPPARTANPNQSQIRLPEKAARMATPPDIQQSGAPPAIAAPVNGPDLNRDIYQGRVAQPNPNDYHGPTGWKGVLDKVGRVVLGEDYDRAFPSPQERYARDEKRFNTAYEHGRQEQEDAEAQQVRAEAATERANKAPTTRSVTVGGQEQIQDWNPATHTWNTEPGVSPAAKTPTEKAGDYKAYTVPGGKTPVMAREDEKGNLIMQDGSPLPPGATLYEKPEAYNIGEQLHAEHPDWTPEQVQKEMSKASYPRIIPVTDAAGNTLGYNYFQGEPGGAVNTQFIPAGAGGAPTQGGVIPAKPGVSLVDQGYMAKGLQDMVTNNIFPAIDEAQKAGQMGPVKGRVQDFLLKRVGDPSSSAAYLQATLDAVPMMLGRIYGYRSADYAREYNNFLNTQMTPDGLKAYLNGVMAHARTIQGLTGPPENQAGSQGGPGGSQRTAKIGGKDVSIGADGTFQMNGQTYRVNADGTGGTLVTARGAPANPQ